MKIFARVLSLALLVPGLLVSRTSGDQPELQIEMKKSMLKHFETEEELRSHLGDADYVTKVLRDHIWWNLN